jgi:hypothetical protein
MRISELLQAEQNSALLGYYAAGSGNSFSTFRDNLLVPSSKINTLKMGRRDSPEKSVRNYHYSLRNKPAQRSSYVPRGGNLKLRGHN